MMMIEKIARAICQADEQNGAAPWDWYGTDKARSGYFDQARAALTALLEPSEGMVDAANEAVDYHSDGGRALIAAIQAALDEKAG